MSRPGTKAAKFPANSTKSNNHLRIIGGSWRGRKLSFPDVEGLRPTGDRIRETLFNWLAPDIQGARCLDLFAGSGALGLEALSRGACFSLLVEKHPLALQQLKCNLTLLNASAGCAEQQDTLAWLAKGNTGAPFDLIFIDPPFALNFWEPVANYLEEGNWLADDARIYLEAPKDTPIKLPSNWLLHRDKQAGQVSYRLYHRQSPVTQDFHLASL